MTYTLTVRKLAWILGGLILLFTVINAVLLIIIYGLDMRNDLFTMLEFRFRVDFERNFPTLFSSGLLFLCSLFLLLIACFTRQKNMRYVFHWALLALIFLFLSVDEFFMIHEKLHTPLKTLMQDAASGIFHYPWVIPYFLAFIVLSLVYLRFFFALPHTTRLWFVISAVCFVGGAVGIEMLSAYMHDAGNLSEHGTGTQLANGPYMAVSALEECMEMTGAALFACALLHYIRTAFGKQQLILALE